MPRRPALGNVCDVFQKNRRAIVGRDSYIPEIREVPEEALAADDELLRASLEHPTAGVDRAFLEALLHIIQSELEGGETGRSRFDMDLANEAAVAHDIGDAVDSHHHRPHDPILERAQLHGVPIGPDHRVAIDLSNRGGVGAQLRGDAFRKLG